MSYHNLSNEEIVFLYYVAKNITKQYENVHHEKLLHQNVPTEFGMIQVNTPLPEDLLDQMLKSEHYVFMKSIETKLKFIVELIEEAEPELSKKVKQIFVTTKKE